MKIVAYFRSLAARFWHRAQTETDLEEGSRRSNENGFSGSVAE